MGKNSSLWKNFILLTAVLAGLFILAGSFYLERMGSGTLMDSFYTEIEGIADMGRIKAWENKEEGLYYVFLPSACKGTEKLFADTSFPEYVLSIEGVTQDAAAGFFYEKDVRYHVEWKLFGRYTVEECELMFVTGEKIPALCLETGTGRSLEEDTAAGKETYSETCSLTVIGADGETLHSLTQAKLGGRGNSTWEAAKKPLKLKLQEPEGLLSMAAGIRYNLIANAFDGSHMRTKLILDVANEASEGFTADGEWVELYYNGEYQGLYLLTEKVEIAENRIEIPSLEEENESVNAKGSARYSEFAFEEAYHGMTIKGVELPAEPEDITGSYLVEIDLKIRYEEEPGGVITPEGEIFTLESPSHASENEVKYIADVLADVESAIYAEDGVSSLSGKKLEELIDLTSFADAYLLGEIAGEQDTGISSQYFYKKPDEESSLLYAASVWDFDGSMGNTNPAMYAYPECLSVSVEEVRGSATGISNKWFSALCKQEVFMERVKERYREVFHEKMQEVLESKLEEYTETIRNAAVRDRLRWNEESGNWPFIWPEGYQVEEEEAVQTGYQAYDRLDAQVNQIREFLERKTEFLYDLWVNGTVYHKVYVKPEAEFLSDTMFYGRYYWVREGEQIPEPPYYTSEWYPDGEYERKGFFLMETGEEVEIMAPVYQDMNISDVWERRE